MRFFEANQPVVAGLPVVKLRLAKRDHRNHLLNRKESRQTRARFLDFSRGYTAGYTSGSPNVSRLYIEARLWSIRKTRRTHSSPEMIAVSPSSTRKHETYLERRQERSPLRRIEKKRKKAEEE